MLAIQGYKGHLAYMASEAVNYVVQSQRWIFSLCQSKYDCPFASVQ